MLSFFASLPFILALAFVCVMVAVALIIENNKKAAKKATGIELSQMEAESSELLKSIASSLNEGSITNLYRFEGGMLVDLIKERLYEAFGSKLSIVHQECNIPETAGQIPRCSSIYGVKTDEGHVLVYLSPYRYKNVNGRGKPNHRLVNSEYQVEDFHIEDNQIDISHLIRVAVPSTMASSHPDILRINEIIEEARIEDIYYEEEPSRFKMQFFSLEKDRHGAYSLKRQQRTIREIRKDLLTLSYNNVDVTYGTENLSVPMGEAINLMQTTLESKENVFIFGVAGSGKSFLADEIARRAARTGNTAVIFISPAMVSELQKVELLPDLLEELTRLKEYEGMSPLFVIDEAEALLEKTDTGIHSVTNSFMLSLLDGQIQKLFDSACLLTFNCDRELLNEKAFRAGRMGLEVKLGEISIDQAAPLTTYLKDANPTLIFDNHKWSKLQAEKTVTLAEVYDCFVTPSKQRVMLQIIRAMKGDTEPDTTTPASTAVRVKAPIAASPQLAPSAKVEEPVAITIPRPVANKHGGNKHKHHNRGHRPGQVSDSRR